MLLLLWTGLLGVSFARGAQVYMEFNGNRYSYNTDGDHLDRSVHLPNYEAAAPSSSPLNSLSSLQFVQQAFQNRQPRISHLDTSSLTGGYLTASNPPANHHPMPGRQNFDFSTHQMAHAQHTDEAGNVLGKYSYYDEAGYHELSYKAGAGIGFVVMGGNLAKATSTAAVEPHSEIAIGNGIQANALTSLQELHKYRGYA
ncbi:uncharacterized protein LOC110190102 [Drosophila serrata]|uniref:uncharacterized protein LOC110190102 n=1 Tax=Drosophila serrata TaxID=7274 RepID=UPI000A1D22A2|nr:uncharacterized protein LOC110190102 [Drosophila serrata]